MQFLDDENVPAQVVHLLRKDGMDVTWILEEVPGLSDERVLEKAQHEVRVLITFDKDFGELARRQGLPAGAGVVPFRIPTRSPSEVAILVLRALRSSDDWAGRFSVVTASGIRSIKE
jgi:predicted nuclease of predicted toxin-antitoxin system